MWNPSRTFRVALGATCGSSGRASARHRGMLARCSSPSLWSSWGARCSTSSSPEDCSISSVDRAPRQRALGEVLHLHGQRQQVLEAHAPVTVLTAGHVTDCDVTADEL